MANSLAVWTELGPMLAALAGRAPRVSFHGWRPGDQRYYVSDTSRVREAVGWTPQVSAQDGVRRLYAWAREHRALFDDPSLAGAYR
jgi:CDP-paratose 2-epimerase